MDMTFSMDMPDAKTVPEGAQNILRAIEVKRSDFPKDPEQIFLTSWGEWWGKDVYGLSSSMRRICLLYSEGVARGREQRGDRYRQHVVALSWAKFTETAAWSALALRTLIEADRHRHRRRGAWAAIAAAAATTARAGAPGAVGLRAGTRVLCHWTDARDVTGDRGSIRHLDRDAFAELRFAL